MTLVIASLAGQTLGRYRLVDKLGSGGMATVYRAEDPTLGRQVAVKVMHPFIAERSEAGSRFAREAKAVAGLRHPNVLQLHDYSPAANDQPAYLVMELLTGPSLQRFLVDHGAPLAEVAAMLGLRIAQALGAAHACGIVHRDVKPENVMFDGHRVVLCDFGIARLAAGDGVTATGAVLGSPAYMSPEQASGGEIDTRSDQFSLGAVLYQLATGSLPFSGTTPLVTMAKIVKGDHAPPSAKNARVPAYLERAIERLLRARPDERFATVDACAEALREGLANDGFVDIDAELTAYLRDPAAYNATAEQRIVAAAHEQAGRAQARGETARALAAANRVLSWRPEDARALALASGLHARPRRLALLSLLLALVVAGSATLAWRRLRVVELKAAPERAALPTAVPTVAPPALQSDLPPPSASGARATRPPAHKPHGAPPPTPPSPPSGASLAPARSLLPAQLPAAPPQPPTQPAADAPATLAVQIAPWCDLTIDGQSRGRAPQTLTLPPGLHHLVCVNPASGNRLARDLELAPGERRELRERLYATVRVQPRLTRGDAFAFDDGKPLSVPTDIEAGRHRVTLYHAGAEVETRWIDVPPGGCLLMDAPRLSCEKP